MNVKKYLPSIILVVIVASFVAFAIFAGEKRQAKTRASSDTGNTAVADQPDSPKQLVVTNADQVIIVHFHGTQQCWSCIEVGKLTQKTLEANFAEELDSEKIVFKEINGELPENREIVQKYQARGSSLFINAIKDDQDHIAEDTTVWRLINSEERFNEYLTEKINNILRDKE